MKRVFLTLAILLIFVSPAEARYLHKAEALPRLERHTLWLTTYKPLGYPLHVCKAVCPQPDTEPPPNGIWPNSGWTCRRWANNEIQCRIIVDRGGVEMVTVHWVAVHLYRNGVIKDYPWYNERKKK